MFGHLLESPRTTYLAAFASLLFGLFFTFVWAPHPWTWEGIDNYHDFARAIVNGEGFNTIDRPWGYAGYVALVYAVFGAHPSMAIAGQLIANAAVPFIVRALVQPLADRRTATLAALLTGVFSFNTVYASTLAADALCTVLFMAGAWTFLRGHRSGSVWPAAASGLLIGVAAQFRPNLLLLAPVVTVAYALTFRGRLAQVASFVCLFALSLAPWVARNYRLTGEFLPSTTRGALQLWYGSLQVGPYLENFSENPRAAFAQSPFDYTSLIDTPVIVTLDASTCSPELRRQLALTHWTDREPTPVTIRPASVTANLLELHIPGQPDGTTVYWSLDGREAPPFVYVVSTAHTKDLDTRHDFEDVFDVIRAMLEDPVSAARLEQSVRWLTGGDAPAVIFERTVDHAMLRLSDRSYLRVPRPFTGDLTDIEVGGTLARSLLGGRRPAHPPPAPPDCLAGKIRVNDAFYRRELHEMRRYTALAIDNVRREPAAFAAAAAYRSIRLFIVRPSGDRGTTYQFSSASLVYGGALALSLVYFIVFVAGVVMAWRRRSALLVLLVPIVYVPATICFVLTNQRYSVTVQPLMFAFVAFAIVTWWERRALKGLEA